MFLSSEQKISQPFLFITCLFVACLLISNIIAGKLVQIWGVVLPAAVILFPLTYVFGDILTEVYGFRRARLVIWIGFIANILMAAVFIVTIALPHPAFWNEQSAFRTVLGFTPRLVAASLVAYWAGEFSNSIVLSKVKILTRGRWLWFRTIGSTVVGEGLDTLLFITIAFAGVLPAVVLFEMMLAQYVWKVGYEIAVTPLTYLLVRWLKRREGLDTYDQGIGYNPFRLEVTGNESH
ncbi:MAG: queuosine precursor transporter [Desulfobacterales bacterium]